MIVAYLIEDNEVFGRIKYQHPESAEHNVDRDHPKYAQVRKVTYKMDSGNADIHQPLVGGVYDQKEIDGGIVEGLEETKPRKKDVVGYIEEHLDGVLVLGGVKESD
jgi:hypothetical protein